MVEGLGIGVPGPVGKDGVVNRAVNLGWGVKPVAQELGDLVFVNLPQVGDAVTAGEAFADVESVKAVSDVYSPVTGTVCEINEALLDAPESINQDPYGAWFIRVENVTGSVETLSAEEYEAMPKEG